MQFSSVLALLALAATTFALPQPTPRSVTFTCDIDNNAAPLFGGCCASFYAGGNGRECNLATKSFIDPSGFTQFTCGEKQVDQGFPACCKTVITHGQGVPDKGTLICTQGSIASDSAGKL